jgi:ketosteroid isomerase-like protein
VEIVDVIGDGDNVAVFARVDRTFKMENKVKVYKGHPYAFFFKFKDGKVVEVIGMFDVLNDVEQYKAEKYKNHKCRQ